MKSKQTIEEKIVSQLLETELLDDVYAEFSPVEDLSIMPKFAESLNKRFIADFSTEIAEIAGQREVSFDKIKKVCTKEGKAYLEDKIKDKLNQQVKLPL